MDSADRPPQFATAQYRDVPTESHALFVRALLFGAGGALLGLVLYSAVGIITGLSIGYVSLAVGYVVGKAVLKGSRGRGGRRYQIAAVLLTYASVSISAVPIALWQFAHSPTTEVAAPAGAVTTVTPKGATSSADPEAAGDGVSVSLLGVLGTLLWIGLASPFLELANPTSGLIGLVILAVGLRIAWQITGSAGTTAAAVGSLAGASAELPQDEKPTSLHLR